MKIGVIDYMKTKYANREDKDNIFPVGISDEEFREFVFDYLLPKDWCVSSPLHQHQVNEVALDDILYKYSRRYRRELRKSNRKKKVRP